jgi:hypothetical protein
LRHTSINAAEDSFGRTDFAAPKSFVIEKQRNPNNVVNPAEEHQRSTACKPVCAENSNPNVVMVKPVCVPKTLFELMT